mgnify:CR=1 FL=1
MSRSCFFIKLFRPTPCCHLFNMASEYEIPKEMKAIKYWKPLDFSYTTVPVPELKPHEILVKGE